MNDEEENSDSTPLLPSARQAEAGERLDHRGAASGSVPGGGWFPDVGAWREWLRAGGREVRVQPPRNPPELPALAGD